MLVGPEEDLYPLPYRAAAHDEKDALRFAALLRGPALIEAVRGSIQSDSPQGLRQLMRAGVFTDISVVLVTPEDWWSATCKPEYAPWAVPLADALATTMSQIKPPPKPWLGKRPAIARLSVRKETRDIVCAALLSICTVVKENAHKIPGGDGWRLKRCTAGVAADVGCSIDAPELVATAIEMAKDIMRLDEGKLDLDFDAEEVTLPIWRAIYFGSMRVLEQYAEYARDWIGIVERKDGRLDYAHFLDFCGLKDGFCPNPAVVEWFLRDQAALAKNPDELLPQRHVEQLRSFILERVIGGHLDCVQLVSTLVRALPAIFDHPQMDLRLRAEIAAVRRGIPALYEHLRSTAPLAILDQREWSKEQQYLLHFQSPYADEPEYEGPTYQPSLVKGGLSGSHPLRLIAEGVWMRVHRKTGGDFPLAVLKDVIDYWSRNDSRTGLVNDLEAAIHGNCPSFVYLCLEEGWVECVALCAHAAPQSFSNIDPSDLPRGMTYRETREPMEAIVRSAQAQAAWSKQTSGRSPLASR